MRRRLRSGFGSSSLFEVSPPETSSSDGRLWIWREVLPLVAGGISGGGEEDEDGYGLLVGSSM